MPFVKRGTLRQQREHECKTPSFRWLPLVVWPRWSVGAQWRCGKRTWDNSVLYGTHENDGWTNGCGQLWEYIAEHSIFDVVLVWRKVEG